MVVYSTMLSASLVERRLVYSATCSFRVLFVVVRLVTSIQSSAMTCYRLENAMDIYMVLFAAPVWYPP